MEDFKRAGVRSFGDNFKIQFVEIRVGGTKSCQLEERHLELGGSIEVPALTMIARMDRVKLTISQFSQFLATNLGSSEWFVASINGKDGRCWAVNALWYHGRDGWRIDADPPF